VASGGELGHLKALSRARNQALISGGTRRARSPLTRARVLFVSDASAFSGAEASLCQTIAALHTSRVEALALVSSAGTLSDRLAASGAAVFCPQRNLHGTNTEGFRYVHGLLSEVRPDVVHFNSAVPPSILYACVAHSLPLVQHVRVAECDELVPQLKAAAGIVAVSDFVKSELATLDIDMARVRVIHNGVDVQQFAPPLPADRRHARDALGLHDGDHAVLCIARFSRAKRVDVAIRAVAAARSAVPSIRLFVVGESFPGDVRDDVGALVDELGVTDIVTFLGFAEDVRTVLAAVDVLLLTAVREPLSRAVLEAMAMGVPCIVPEDGGLVEVIQDGVTGRKVVPSTAEGFAIVLGELLAPDAAARRESMGRAARRFVERHLTARQCAAALEDVFVHLTGALP
jgi:glycosyltransferase involved in cell wall biosynthesis